MYKAVLRAPEWVKAPAGADVYSVSGCISRWFADYIPYWSHNGFWFFDRPEIIRQVANEHGIDLSDKMLFYYELFEHQYHEDTGSWLPLPLDLAFATNVQVPSDKQLAGYDVVTYSCGTSPECSPLSCNSLAPLVGVNDHCLLESLEKARASLEAHQFDASEPGPFRVLSVYTTPER